MEVRPWGKDTLVILDEHPLRGAGGALHNGLLDAAQQIRHRAMLGRLARLCEGTDAPDRRTPPASVGARVRSPPLSSDAWRGAAARCAVAKRSQEVPRVPKRSQEVTEIVVRGGRARRASGPDRHRHCPVLPCVLFGQMATADPSRSPQGTEAARVYRYTYRTAPGATPGATSVQSRCWAGHAIWRGSGRVRLPVFRRPVWGPGPGRIGNRGCTRHCRRARIRGRRRSRRVSASRPRTGPPPGSRRPRRR